MITATPFLAAAADAKLEDWGPLEEATGEPMHTSGTTLWSGEGAQEKPGGECAHRETCGLAIISQKMARTAAKAGKPKANHSRKSLW